MGNWGFVALAYGVALGALLGYLLLLWGRLRGAQGELATLEQDGGKGRR